MLFQVDSMIKDILKYSIMLFMDIYTSMYYGHKTKNSYISSCSNNCLIEVYSLCMAYFGLWKQSYAEKRPRVSMRLCATRPGYIITDNKMPDFEF